jgi:hypothetical protein
MQLKNNPTLFPDRCQDPLSYAAIRKCVKCDSDNY